MIIKGITPAPWHSVNTGDDQGLIIGENGRNVAVAYNKVDASLIAAAPDLLAALRIACAVLEERHDEGTLPTVRNILYQVEKSIL
jgi:hypothetical protein